LFWGTEDIKGAIWADDLQGLMSTDRSGIDDRYGLSRRVSILNRFTRLLSAFVTIRTQWKPGGQTFRHRL
jgi:hypothetical protein